MNFQELKIIKDEKLDKLTVQNYSSDHRKQYQSSRDTNRCQVINSSPESPHGSDNKQNLEFSEDKPEEDNDMIKVSTKVNKSNEAASNWVDRSNS